MYDWSLTDTPILEMSNSSQSFYYGGPNVSWNEITTPAQFIPLTAGPSRPGPQEPPKLIEPPSPPPQKSPRKYLTSPEDKAQSAQTAARCVLGFSTFLITYYT